MTKQKYVKQLAFMALVALSVILFNIPINPLKEAYALQQVNVTTSAIPSAIQMVFSGVDQRYVYVDIEGKTQVRVFDANSTTLIRTFNMSNALMNGFNINYALLNLDCNGNLGICVAGYGTQGSGTCALSPNLCRDRVVLINYGLGTWSGLSHGFNYTHTSNIMYSSLMSYGITQFNVFVMYQPVGGGNAKIDTLVYNSSDLVDSHALILGNTFDTNTNTGYKMNKLGTFISGGVLSNYEAGAETASNTFITFNRSNNGFGCSVGVGGSPINDITYANDSIGTFWYTIQGTTIKKINSSCTVITTTDLTLATGGNNLNSIAINSARHEIYTASNSKLFVVNETSLSLTPIVSLGITSNPATYGDIGVYSQNINTANVAVGTGASIINVIYWNFQGSYGSGSGATTPTNTCNSTQPIPHCQGQVDCSLPQNINLVTCYSVYGSGGTGNGDIFSGNNNLFLNNTNMIAVQAVGLKNNDIKTNGVGYALMGIVLLIANILWLLAVHNFSSRGTVIAQPIFVNALLSFCIIFAFVLAGITDALFLVVGIVALVAFATPKLVSMIRGQETSTA